MWELRPVTSRATVDDAMKISEAAQITDDGRMVIPDGIDFNVEQRAQAKKMGNLGRMGRSHRGLLDADDTNQRDGPGRMRRAPGAAVSSMTRAEKMALMERVGRSHRGLLDVATATTTGASASRSAEEKLPQAASRWNSDELRECRADGLSCSSKDSPGKLRRQMVASAASSTGEPSSSPEARVVAELLLLEAEWLMVETKRLMATELKMREAEVLTGEDDIALKSAASKEGAGKLAGKQRHPRPGMGGQGAASQPVCTGMDAVTHMQIGVAVDGPAIAIAGSSARESTGLDPSTLEARQLVLEASWLMLKAEKMPEDTMLGSSRQVERAEVPKATASKSKPGRAVHPRAERAEDLSAPSIPQSTLRVRLMSAHPTVSEAQRLPRLDSDGLDSYRAELRQERLRDGKGAVDGPGRLRCRTHAATDEMGCREVGQTKSLRARVAPLLGEATVSSAQKATAAPLDERNADRAEFRACVTSATKEWAGRTKRAVVAPSNLAGAAPRSVATTSSSRDGDIGQLLALPAAPSARPTSPALAVAPADGPPPVSLAVERMREDAKRLLLAAERVAPGTLTSIDGDLLPYASSSSALGAELEALREEVREELRSDKRASQATKDRPGRWQATRKVAKTVASSLANSVTAAARVLATNPLEDEEDRNDQARRLMERLRGKVVTDAIAHAASSLGAASSSGDNGGRACGDKRKHCDAEERAERSAAGRERAGKLRLRSRGAGEAEEGGRLRRTKQSLHVRRLKARIQGSMARCSDVDGASASDNGATDGQRGSNARGSGDAERMKARLAERRRSSINDAGGTGFVQRRSGSGGSGRCFSRSFASLPASAFRGSKVDEDAEDELADREGEKGGAGRFRSGRQGPKPATDERFRRTRQRMLARRLAKSIGAVGKKDADADEGNGQVATTSTAAAVRRLKKKLPEMASRSQAVSDGGTHPSLAPAYRISSSLSPEENVMRVQDELRALAKQVYEADKRRALRAAQCMTREDLLDGARAGLVVCVDGHAGVLLPPVLRPFWQRLLQSSAESRRQRRVFRIQFEHKAAPLEMELVHGLPPLGAASTSSIRQGARSLGSGRLAVPNAKSFVLKRDQDAYEARYVDAMLEADRAGARLLTQLACIDMGEEADFQRQMSARNLLGEEEVRSSLRPRVTLRVVAGGGAGKAVVQRRHSIEKAPSGRRMSYSCKNKGGARGGTAPSSVSLPAPHGNEQDKEGPEGAALNSARLRALESRLDRVDDLVAGMKDIKVRVKEAAKALPAPRRLPAPTPASCKPGESAALRKRPGKGASQGVHAGGGAGAPPKVEEALEKTAAPAPGLTSLPPLGRLPAPLQGALLTRRRRSSAAAAMKELQEARAKTETTDGQFYPQRAASSALDPPPGMALVSGAGSGADTGAGSGAGTGAGTGAGSGAGSGGSLARLGTRRQSVGLRLGIGGEASLTRMRMANAQAPLSTASSATAVVSSASASSSSSSSNARIGSTEGADDGSGNGPQRLTTRRMSTAADTMRALKEARSARDDPSEAVEDPTLLA